MCCPLAGSEASAPSVLVLALLVLAGRLARPEVPENVLPTLFCVVGCVAVPLSVGVLRAGPPAARLGTVPALVRSERPLDRVQNESLR
jgi:hypothetical protein